MKCTDQLTMLEAFVLGYALSDKANAAKVFAVLPASEWLGPFGDMARQLQEGGLLRLNLLGIELDKPASAVKAIVNELIAAETEKRKKNNAERLKEIAAKLNDPATVRPGEDLAAQLETIAKQTRGYNNGSLRKKAGHETTGTVSGELAKAAGASASRHQVPSGHAQRVGKVADVNGDVKASQTDKISGRVPHRPIDQKAVHHANT